MNESQRRRFRMLIVVSWLVILAAYGGIAYLMVAAAGAPAGIVVFVFGYMALLVTLVLWLGPKILRHFGLMR